MAPDDESEAPLDDLKSRLVNVDPLLFFFANQTNRKYKIKKIMKTKNQSTFGLTRATVIKSRKCLSTLFFFTSKSIFVLFSSSFCFHFFLSLGRPVWKRIPNWKGPIGERERDFCWWASGVCRRDRLISLFAPCHSGVGLLHQSKHNNKHPLVNSASCWLAIQTTLRLRTGINASPRAFGR